jgi:hypothetical protein
MTRISGFNLVGAKCCGAIYATARYTSLNMMATAYWTDGAVDGALVPTDGGLRKCDCGSYYLLQDTFKLGTSNETQLPLARRVLDEELQAVLQQKLSTNVELVVRRRYWHLLNSAYRNEYIKYRNIQNENVFQSQAIIKRLKQFLKFAERHDAQNVPFAPKYTPTKDQVYNIERLLALLMSREHREYLDIAEAYRELSRFADAAEAVRLSQEQDSARAKLILRLAMEEVNAPYRYRL